MKTILRVARTELLTLFYSPIAWFLLVVFMIQCGVVYLNALEGAARMQELGGMSIMYLNTLTERVFLGQGGLFPGVMQNLYLYIPLLTMGLVSRETSSGTIKLLYSSPIKVREIVLGKYLAMMVYSLLLLAIVGIFVVAGMSQIQFPEKGMLMIGLLGFYLLLCAYSAIGLFMSCLTTYPVVAAVCTFVMIGILSYIGTLWQDVAFVRSLTYFLSINGRTQKMLAGLLTTKDIIYFLVIIYMFLGFSIYKLKDGMESKPLSVRMGRYSIIVVSALFIGYVTAIPGFIGYFDATNNKTRTLTPVTQHILADLGDEPLEITTYNNLLGSFWYLGNASSYNSNMARWEPYQRFKHNITLNPVVSYYDSTLDNSYLLRSYPDKNLQQVAEQYAKTMRVNLKDIHTPAEIRKMIDLRPELNRYVMQLKWKGRTTFLRVFDDMQVWPGETEVSAALKRLQQARMPKVVFVTGDLERNIHKSGDREYKILTNMSTFRYSLINQGFDVDTVSLDNRDIPAGIAALVVADPKVELSPVAMARLQQYIDNGGNLLIAGEPGKQAILNPLLQPLGVKLEEGTILEQSKEDAPNLVKPSLTKMAGSFTKPLARSLEDSQHVSMPGVAGLSYTTGGSFTIQPLLVTDTQKTWNRMKPLDLDMMQRADAGPGMAMAMAGSVVTVSGAAVSVSVTPSPSTRPAASGPMPHARERQFHTGNASDSGRHAHTMEMTPEMKQHMDSMRNAMREIMTGSGTKEEKQQKMMALMAKARQQGHGTPHTAASQAGVPVTASQPTVVKHQPTPTPATDEEGDEDDNPRSRFAKRKADIGTVTFSPADGDTKGPLITAVSLTRTVKGHEQRIIVTGDADFMSNNELRRNGQANFVFNTGLFSWLSYGEFPIDASRPAAKDKRVNVTLDQVSFLRIVYIWVLPAILVIFGTVLLIRRKRK